MLKSIEKATAIRAGMSRDNVNNLKPKATSASPTTTKSRYSPRKKATRQGEQKKKNPIKSEKKRRDVIRAGFEKLAEIAPSVPAMLACRHEQPAKKEHLKDQARHDGMSEGDFELV